MHQLDTQISFSPAGSSSQIELSRRLTDKELEILPYLCLGLTDKAIALRQDLTLRAVQNRVMTLQMKLLQGTPAIVRLETGVDVFNTRTRSVFEALKLGVVGRSSLQLLDAELDSWIKAAHLP